MLQYHVYRALGQNNSKSDNTLCGASGETLARVQKYKHPGHPFSLSNSRGSGTTARAQGRATPTRCELLLCVWLQAPAKKRETRMLRNELPGTSSGKNQGQNSLLPFTVLETEAGECVDVCVFGGQGVMPVILGTTEDPLYLLIVYAMWYLFQVTAVIIERTVSVLQLGRQNGRSQCLTTR